MTAKIRPRGDTATNWTTNNPTLALREFALETDTLRYKVGDGVTAWTSLPYFNLGIVQQRVLKIDTTTSSGTAAFPTDDTIPQSTEGWALFEQAITPLSSASYIYVKALIQCSVSAAEWIMGGLWLDSESDARAVNQFYQLSGGGGGVLPLTYRYTNSNKTAKTFKVRMSTFAGTATLYVNNMDGVERYGNTLTSYLELTEVLQ